jgi:hypothetical protein
MPDKEIGTDWVLCKIIEIRGKDDALEWRACCDEIYEAIKEHAECE